MCSVNAWTVAAEDEPAAAPVAPFIVSEPLDQTVPAGTDVLFTVTAGGTAPRSYQWRKNGAPLGGQNAASLFLDQVTSNDAGSYSVAISNEVGVVMSAAKTLTVITETLSHVYWVTTTNDSVAGSLRDAVLAANTHSGSGIFFSNLTGRIALSGGELVVSNSTRFFGPAARSLEVSGESAGRVFNVTSNATHASIFGLTISNGRVATNGAGIFNAGELVVENCVIVNNVTVPGSVPLFSFAPPPASGAGIFNSGILDLRLCIVSSNGCGPGITLQPGSAGGSGGGVFNEGEMTLADSTIHGNAGGKGGDGFFGSGGSGGSGGGICNAGTLSLNGCTLSANVAGKGGTGWGGEDTSFGSFPGFPGGRGGLGGGLYNTGILGVTNCTFANNLSGQGGTGGPGGLGRRAELPGTPGGDGGNSGDGGGIHNEGSIVVCNDTITGNATAPGGFGGLGGLGGCCPAGPAGPTGSPGAPGNGGGLSGNVNLLNTLVVSNLTAGAAPDAAGAVVSLGFNLVTDSTGNSGLGIMTGDILNVAVLLGPLTDNGGPTFTCAISSGSLANNAGTTLGAPPVDQRHVIRPPRKTVDIGAFEFVGTPPSISVIPNLLTDEDTVASTGCTVGDIETPAASLQISARSSNTSLLPNENISFGGSSSSRTLTLAPATNQFGTSTIDVTVRDPDGNTGVSSFQLVVQPINDPPTLDMIPDRLVYENSGPQVVVLSGITAGPSNETGQAMTVTAVSSNPGLIPAPSVNYLSPDSGGSITFTSAPDASGSSVITVTVRDSAGGEAGFSRRFRVTVLPTLQFAVGSASARQFQEVLMPIRVGGFVGISSFQFSLRWAPGLADFVRIENFGLAGLTVENFGTTQTNAGVLTVAWDDPDGTCKSVADGSIIFAVRFFVRGDWGSTNSVSIGSVPTVLEAVNCALGLVPIAVTPGRIILPPAVTLSGTVRSADSSNRVSGTVLALSGAISFNAITDVQGAYQLNNVPPGDNYVLTPSKTTDSPNANGVTAMDIAIIRRHILGVLALDSGRKLLAADVSGSRSVSTLDITLIRRLILGLTNTFPAGLWRFVPSDFMFVDPENPWDAPGHRIYTGLQENLVNQDFMAIKLGDVNDSWEPAPSQSNGGMRRLHARGVGNPGAALGSDTILKLSRHVVQRGDSITARVTVQAFRQVSSAQFTVEWDPTVLRYDNTEPGLSGMDADNFGTTATASGKLAFSWDDPAGLGVTLADGSTLCSVHFSVVGTVGTSSPLALTDGIAARELGVNFSVANLQTDDGLVSVVEVAPPTLRDVAYVQGSVRVACPTVAGKRYTLEFSNVLPAIQWTALPTIIGDGSVTLLVDPSPSSQQRFYRIRVE
jgi:hypothetical protein